jgi:hypothetical protein
VNSSSPHLRTSPARDATANQKPPRSLGLALAPAAILAVFCTLAAHAITAIASSSRPHHSHHRHTLSVTDTAHLTLVHNGGELITEAGNASGTLPGRVRVYLKVGPVVVAKFTIYASGGTISGQGSGRPKGGSQQPRFSGAMIVTHGTGRYKGARAHGTFYGQLNRDTYRMYVKTTGTLHYH